MRKTAEWKMKSDVGGERVEEETKGKNNLWNGSSGFFPNLHKTAIWNAEFLKDIFVLQQTKEY